MVTREQAREIADNQLRQLYGEGAESLAIDDRATREEAFGWVFFYQSRQFLETRDRHHCIRGNSPLIVDRRDGSRIGNARAPSGQAARRPVF